MRAGRLYVIVHVKQQKQPRASKYVVRVEKQQQYHN